MNTHLSILRQAGLVTRRREGRQVIYARTATGDDLALLDALDLERLVR